MRELLDYQLRAVNKLEQLKVGALFMEAGTGKTQVAINLLRTILNIQLVIWLCPLRAIENIKKEIRICGDLTCEIKFVGIESISMSDRLYSHMIEIVKSISPVAIVCDESLLVKNFNAKRTKRIIELGRYVDYRLILNGTPISKNMLDIWAQFQFLSPSILNMPISKYKNTFCKYKTITKYYGKCSTSFDIITGYANIDYLYSLIHYYVFEADLKLNISTRYTVLNYMLTPECKYEYNKVKDRYLTMDTFNKFNNNIFILMTQKLQYSYQLDESKFNLLDKLFLTIAEDKSIIYCKFVLGRLECKRRYPKAMILSYQNQSMSLNLQDFNHIIYFDKTWDLATKIQTSRRIYRVGQDFDCFYYDLTGNVGLESLITNNINNKISMLDYFKSKTKEEIIKVL